MSVYIGLILLDPIANKTRYSETVNEIKHFLQTYEEELIVEVSKSLITIKPKFGGSEASFPLSNSYLHTTYFRISSESKPSDDIKLFSYVVWECCCIFKENFPSRIELFQENLDQVSSIVKSFSFDEILRRQISTLNSRKYANDPLRQDEIEDVFCILENASKRKNMKGLSVCLNILTSNQLCHGSNLKNLAEKNIKAVEGVVSMNSTYYDTELEDEKNFKDVELNKQLAANLLMRISNANSYDDPKISKKQPLSEIDPSEPKPTIFEKPLALKTSLFQLNESNDMNRIVFLLDNIISSHLSKLLQTNFNHFYSILTKITQKYSNGDFGFDNNENSKYCILQNRLFKCILACLDYDSNLASHIDPEILNILSQIMEECCLYIIENISNYDRKHEFEYKLFFEQSFKMFEILLANNTASQIEEVTNSMRSILDRIKMYFSTHSADDELDLEEVGVFYNDLKSYYEDVKHLLLKGKTLADIVSTSNKKKFTNRSVEYKENYYHNS